MNERPFLLEACNAPLNADPLTVPVKNPEALLAALERATAVLNNAAAAIGDRDGDTP